jgi:lipopolysaccharide export system protein LptC
VIDLRAGATFAALGVAAAFSWWVVQVSAPLAPRAVGPRHLPDYHFVGPRITRFGADGRVALDLTAARALHYPDDDTIALEGLRLSLTTDQGVTWRMGAATGVAPMTGDRIDLAGKVTVERPGPSGGVRLATESLTVEPRAQRLSTGAPIELRAGTSQVEAVGMHADLVAGRIVLDSRIRGRYAPR